MTAFEMLTAAVNIAKDLQVANTEDLRALMIKRFPGDAAAIEQALGLWRDYVRRHGCDQTQSITCRSVQGRS